jgi:ATP-binding protein involved in chromosome partitioning
MKYIIVHSGKGGVGKSTVAFNLAMTLKKYFKVGLMDLDIHGPNTVRMSGKNFELKANGDMLIAPDFNGIKYISVGMMLPQKDSPIIWRGPLKTSLIKQFTEKTFWGDTELMICDMPPGTGDEAIDLSNAVKIDGAILITTPSKLSVSDFKRSVGFVKKLEIPIIGAVINMDSIICPNCGSKFDIPSGFLNKTLEKESIKILAKLPFIPEVSSKQDKGVLLDNSVYSTYFEKLAEYVKKFL